MLENSKKSIITKIEVQKKNINRRSVFLDGEYRFSVSIETLSEYQLKNNQQISEALISEIIAKEQFYKAKNLILRYLAPRIRTEKEVSDYLKNKDFNSDTIIAVIKYCKERKYINDIQFASAFVKDQIKFNKRGRNKLKILLYQKGISSEIIDIVFAELVKEQDQYLLAKSVGSKKITSLLNKKNPSIKLYNYLIQRGFDFNIAKKVSNELIKEN